MNINTQSYWDGRFRSGDWELRGGRGQTRAFAESQVRRLTIPADFSGILLDFGCGLGDAMPVYRQAYPRATLLGVDHSAAAIADCRRTYGLIAEFIQADYRQIPDVDVIIASNVFEHLSQDLEIARCLLNKCRDLYIVVPYLECLAPGSEHINSYDKDYFRRLGKYECTVFPTRGWSQCGWDLWFGVYLKNLLRPLFGKRIRNRRTQIIFHFTNAAAGRHMLRAA